jgi:hypothetical protein
MRLRRLIAPIGFGVLVFCLVWLSLGVTLLFAGAGHNPVVREKGHRVAHFGWPFRFATSDMDDAAISYSPPDGEGIAVGTDAIWNPYQIPTEFDDAELRRSWGANFGLLASLSLLVWLAVAARRRARGRLPRPSAHPSA